MRKSFATCLFVGLFVVALAGTMFAQCSATGFVRDGINMTAAVINPTVPVTTVNAAGCNIGVYVDNGDITIDRADISGANYFGIVVNGDVNTVSASITNSNIHNIGENPFNGSQHGVGIYFRAMNLTSSAGGTIANNTVYKYQKNGIVVSGQGANVAITDNLVTGEGPINYIAQNGIQVSYGAMSSVMRNQVYGNSYSGPNGASSGGILVVGGGWITCPDGNACPYVVNARIMQNTLLGNDVGVFLYNADANYNVPTTQTNIKVVNNTISSTWSGGNAANATGNVNGPYMAGVSDFGNGDKVVANNISGYPACDPLGLCTAIDTTGSAKIKVHANTTD